MPADERTEAQTFEGWAILELMGHRRLGGYVRQVELFGSAMCRLDVPEGDGQAGATQFYSGGAIYCVTPTTEATARRVAAGFRPEPVSEWQLPKLPAPAPAPSRSARDYYDPEDCEPERDDDDDDDES